MSRKLRYAVTAAVAAAILVLSLIPRPPDITGGFRYGDKLAHFAAYFVLSLLVAVTAARRTRLKTWILAVAAGLLYGALIEFLQYFTPRQMEALDLAFNLAGSLCGASVSLPLMRRKPAGGDDS